MTQAQPALIKGFLFFGKQDYRILTPVTQLNFDTESIKIDERFGLSCQDNGAETCPTKSFRMTQLQQLLKLIYQLRCSFRFKEHTYCFLNAKFFPINTAGRGEKENHFKSFLSTSHPPGTSVVNHQ